MANLEVGFKGNIITSLTKLKGLIKSTDTGIETITKSTDKMNDSFKKMKFSTDGVSKNLVNTNKSTSVFSKSTNKLDGILKRLRGTLTRAKKSLSDIKEGMNDSTKATDESIVALKKLVGAYLAFDTAKTVIMSSVTAFMELEDAILAVQKTTGLSTKDVTALTDEFKEMSVTMNGFPIQDLLEIGEIAGQLGVKGTENIKTFTKEMQFMATSSKLTAEQASTGFAQIANSLDVAIKDINKVTGAFTALASSTTATEGQLLDFTQRLAGAGKTLELTNSQIIAIGATLKDVGISAEVGGTAMSDVFKKMATDTENFARIANIELQSFTDMVNDEPIKALEAFLKGLNSLDKVGRLNALKEAKLNGGGLSRVLLGLSANTDRLTKNINTSTKAYEEGTATQKEYEVSAESLSKKLDKMHSALTIVGAELGNKFVPLITKGSEVLTTMSKYATENAETLEDVAKALTIATGAVLIFSKALTASPIGRTIALMTALVVVVNELADAYINVAHAEALGEITDAKARNLEQEAKIADVYGKKRNNLLAQQLQLQKSIAMVTENDTISEENKLKALTALGDQYNKIRSTLDNYEETLDGVGDTSENAIDEIKALTGTTSEFKKFSEGAKNGIKDVNSSFNNLSTNSAIKEIEELRDRLFSIANIDIEIALELGQISETEAIQKEIELLKEKQLITVDILEKKNIELDIITRENTIIDMNNDALEEANERNEESLEAQLRIKKLISNIESSTSLSDTDKLINVDALKAQLEQLEDVSIKVDVEVDEFVVDTPDDLSIDIEANVDVPTSPLNEFISKALELEQELKALDLSATASVDAESNISLVKEELELLKEKLSVSIQVTAEDETQLNILENIVKEYKVNNKEVVKTDKINLKAIEKETASIEARTEATERLNHLMGNTPEMSSLEESIREEIKAINELREVGGLGAIDDIEVEVLIEETINKDKLKAEQELNDAFISDFGDVMGDLLVDITKTLISGGQIEDGVVNGALLSSGNPYAMALGATGMLVSEALSEPMDDFQAELANIGAENKGINNSMDILNNVQFEHLTHTSAMRDHLQSMDNSFNAIAISLANAGGVSGDGFASESSIDMASTFGIGDLASEIPVIGDLIGGLVGSFFGSTSVDVVQSGIDFGEQTVAGFMEGVDAVNFQVSEVTQRALFGIIKSTSFDTQTAELNSEIEGMFQDVIGDAVGLLQNVGATLELDEDAINEAILNTEIDIGKLDFLDKTEAEINEILSGVFGRVIGDLAEESIPQIEEFRLAGEDYLTALVRVSTGVEQAQEALRQIDIEAIDFQDIEIKTGDVFDNLIRDSILEVESFMSDEVQRALNNALDFNLDTSSFEEQFTGIGEIISNLNQSGTELINTYGNLIQSQEQLVEILGSGEITQTILDEFEDVTDLISSQSTFLNEFFSVEELMDRLQDELDREFSLAFGTDTTAPSDKEDFRELIEAIDTSTAEGQTLYGQLIGFTDEVLELSSLTSSFNDSLLDAENERLDLESEQLEELRLANELALEASEERQRWLDVTNPQLDGIASNGEVTDNLADDVGGFDELDRLQSFFIENFQSDAEQLAYETEQLRIGFFELGITTMPKTREELDNIVEALDLTTESGLETYAGILELSEAFADITDPIESAIDANEDYIESLKENAESFKNLRQDIDSTINDILDINQGESSDESRFRQLVEFNKLQDDFERESLSPTTDVNELQSIFDDLQSVSLGLANNFSNDDRLTADIVRQLETDKSIAGTTAIQQVEVINNQEDTDLLGKVVFALGRTGEETVKMRKLIRELLEEQEAYNSTQASTV